MDPDTSVSFPGLFFTLDESADWLLSLHQTADAAYTHHHHVSRHDASQQGNTLFPQTRNRLLTQLGV